MTYDFEPFLDWVREELLPLPADADCYDVADRVCIAYTLGEPLDPVEWRGLIEQFRDAQGMYVERDPTHHPWHSTAFAFGALYLLGAVPGMPEPFTSYRDATRAVEFLHGLDWTTSVYLESHRGAALCSLAALVPGFAEPAWFEAVFDELDTWVMPANGMMGKQKPLEGDLDQIGGTFHYHFLYEHLGRNLPNAPARVDAVLGLQQPDGIWHRLNPVWLTLDGVYLMTRSAAQCEDRRGAVGAALDRTLQHFSEAVCVPEFFDGPLPTHSCTAVVSLLAEAQRFLGVDAVRTASPLRLVLDARPFI
jgi:hypothetical protein